MQDYHGEKLRCTDRRCIQVGAAWAYFDSPAHKWTPQNWPGPHLPSSSSPPSPMRPACLINRLWDPFDYPLVLPIPPSTLFPIPSPWTSLWTPCDHPFRPLLPQTTHPQTVSDNLISCIIISCIILRCFDKNGIGTIARQELHSIFEVSAFQKLNFSLFWSAESWRTSWRGRDWGAPWWSRWRRGDHHLLRILWHQKSQLSRDQHFSPTFSCPSFYGPGYLYCQSRFTSKLTAICEFNFVDRKCPPAHHTDHSGIRDVFHFTEIVQTGEELLLGTFSGSTLSDWLPFWYEKAAKEKCQLVKKAR